MGKTKIKERVQPVKKKIQQEKYVHMCRLLWPGLDINSGTLVTNITKSLKNPYP